MLIPYQSKCLCWLSDAMSIARRALSIVTTLPSIFAIETVICLYTLFFVKYTEIDWIAYMQEVEGFLGGELNYEKLKGDTGPLVYPAGFVYIYAGLRAVTKNGLDVWTAQCIFTALYLVTLAVVIFIYRKSHAPNALLIVLVLSRRIHSIFILRLFNDAIAMLLCYIAISCFITRRWYWGSLMYSAAVSVKMNVLLMAPGLLHVYLMALGPVNTIVQLSICAGFQLFVGAPFLLHDWRAYLKKAFELNRVFTYTWTVNFRFLSEEVFISPYLGLGLLGGTLICWVLLWRRRWQHRKYQNADEIVATMFESNLVGVALSRTLHYQFYVWFFHQLPFAAWRSAAMLSGTVRIAIFVAVEIAFNVFPSTWWSSAMLQLALLTLLLGLIFSPETSQKALNAPTDRSNRNAKKTR